MNRSLRFVLLAACVALVATACRVAPGQTGGRERLLAPTGAAAAAGAVRISIAWPARETQVIPAETDKVSVSVYRGMSGTVIASATLLRSAGTLSSTATLDGLPVGAVLISAVAQDAAGKTLAAGSVSLTIEPNAITPAALTLQSILKPVITGLSVGNGLPGAQVAILGSGFGAATDSAPAVMVGGVAGASVLRVNSGLVTFQVPAAATTSPIFVTFNSETATSSSSFTTLKTVEIAPASTTSFAPFGFVKFELTGRDSAGATVSAPNIPLNVVARSCTGTCSNTDEIIGTSKLAVGEEAGTITVQAGVGSYVANAVVSVHPFGRADVPSDMTALPPVPVPVGNELTTARVALGKKLFSDKKLSGNQKMSCATCHDPNKGWSDGEQRSTANDPTKKLPWNSLSILDSAYLPKMFWNGRKTTLEEQVIAVFGIPLAMNASLSVISKYAAETYKDEFIAAYGATPSADALLIAKAISAFERTVVSPQNTSPFDRWMGGDDNAMSAAARRGLAQFLGRSQCIACHTGTAFTDGKFHNIAIPSVLAPPGAVAVNAKSEYINGRIVDWARYNISNNIADLGAIRTPTLRNIEVTGPYMHNGSKPTLEEVVKHYETFDREFPNVSPLMPFEQVGNNVEELVAFMKALTATPSITLD
ncbi:MAG: hypothetical protein FJZ01_07315 [Candidatus Sericytochromatia bacterium]|nr:hypothetical protein [Candidatus Tanganyikabacteria bacterium]